MLFPLLWFSGAGMEHTWTSHTQALVDLARFFFSHWLSLDIR